MECLLRPILCLLFCYFIILKEVKNNILLKSANNEGVIPMVEHIFILMVQALRSNSFLKTINS